MSAWRGLLGVGVIAVAVAGGIGVSRLTKDHPHSAERLFALYEVRRARVAYCVTDVFTWGEFSESYPPQTHCAAPGGWSRSDRLSPGNDQLLITRITRPEGSWLCQSGERVEELCYSDPDFAEVEGVLLVELTPTLDIWKETLNSNWQYLESPAISVSPATPIVTTSETRIAGEEVSCIEQDWQDGTPPYVACFTEDGLQVAEYDIDFRREAIEIRRDISLDEFELPYATTTPDDPRIADY
jgi:hypothetical protein